MKIQVVAPEPIVDAVEITLTVEEAQALRGVIDQLSNIAGIDLCDLYEQAWADRGHGHAPRSHRR